MASVSDIREWAEATGHDLTGVKGVTAPIRRAYDSAHPDPEVFISQSDEDSGDTVQEKAPVIKELSPADKARSIVSRVRASGGSATKAKPRKPSKPRVAVDRFITRAWSFVAQAIQPINPPMARMLDVQAPVAGMVLEDTVRGTLADKLLQPLARAEGQGEVVFALLGPPLLVGAITARPEMAPLLVPILKEAMRSWIDIAGDKIEVAKKRDQDFEDKYGMQIDAMLGYIFDGPQETPGD